MDCKQEGKSVFESRMATLQNNSYIIIVSYSYRLSIVIYIYIYIGGCSSIHGQNIKTRAIFPYWWVVINPTILFNNIIDKKLYMRVYSEYIYPSRLHWHWMMWPHSREKTTAGSWGSWASDGLSGSSSGWGMVEGDHDVTETEMLKWLTACRRFSKLHRDI